MGKTVSIVLIGGFILLSHSYAQEVSIGRETKPKSAKADAVPSKQAKTETHIDKASPVDAGKTKTADKQTKSAQVTSEQDRKQTSVAAEPAKKTAANATTESTAKSANTSTPAHKEQKTTQVTRKEVTPAQKSVPATVSEVSPKPEAVASSHPKGSAPKVRPETVAKAESGNTPKQTNAAKTAKAESVRKTPSVPSAPEATTEVAASQDIPSGKKHSWFTGLAGTPQQPEARATTTPEASGTVLKPAPVMALPTRTLAVPFNGAPNKQPAVAALPSKKAAAEVDDVTSLAVPLKGPARKEGPVLAKSLAMQTQVSDSTVAQPTGNDFETAFTKLADGFDYPVGKPDAQGYYKARGFRSHGHLGEDWDGVRGGDTDLGDPIYSIGDGIVVFARDCHMGWGNVVIVRHTYREGGTIKDVDSLYGHLNTMVVRRGQVVARGQRIATMGTAHGLYDAHLHLEIRKNIEIGMSRAAFARDFSNYYDPSQFIQAHRHLTTGGGTYRVAMNTFTRDANIKWDKVHNYSHAHTGGGSRESSAALKRAVASEH